MLSYSHNKAISPLCFCYPLAIILSSVITKYPIWITSVITMLCFCYPFCYVFAAMRQKEHFSRQIEHYVKKLQLSEYQ